mmetsp:Transcript_17608/g.19760  ORF Transcript_17608/g.19760 Transcript_17608/m.19760 type:complete len:322 (+) Transcript_17608:116-1081(+)
MMTMFVKNFSTAKSLTIKDPRTAVVVGATNGIGKACAHRLAGAGFNVIAVGRDKPGRAASVVAELNEQSPPNSHPAHEFRPCDAFSLGAVKECAEGIVKDHGTTGIDALVMTQGMATIQSFTPTVDGNDEKITLHYWSRMAFSSLLLSSLRASTMPGGACVTSVLSGGVHNPYREYKTDPFLQKSYSIPRAADSAGYYTDLFLDSLAHREGNERINFMHAAPGLVNSNWGTEFPWYVRFPVRGMQSVFAKSPEKCAAFMCDPIMKSVSEDFRKKGKEGVYILNADATDGTLTKEHTEEAMTSIWKMTADILGKAGIDVNNE